MWNLGLKIKIMIDNFTQVVKVGNENAESWKSISLEPWNYKWKINIMIADFKKVVKNGKINKLWISDIWKSWISDYKYARLGDGYWRTWKNQIHVYTKLLSKSWKVD